LFSYSFPVVAVAVLQLRRERIAERMKALQELVSNANKVRSIAYTLALRRRERRDCRGGGLGFWLLGDDRCW